MIYESLVKGKDIYLFRYSRIGGVLRYSSLGLATSHTMSIKFNTINTASDENKYVTDKKLQSIEYTISIDCLYLNNDYYDILSLATEGTNIAFYIGELNKEITDYPYNDIRSPLNEHKLFLGGIITNIELNSQSDNITTYKVTISGTSDIIK